MTVGCFTVSTVGGNDLINYFLCLILLSTVTLIMNDMQYKLLYERRDADIGIPLFGETGVNHIF